MWQTSIFSTFVPAFLIPPIYHLKPWLLTNYKTGNEGINKMFFLILPSGLLVSYLGKLEDRRPDISMVLWNWNHPRRHLPLSSGPLAPGAVSVGKTCAAAVLRLPAVAPGALGSASRGRRTRAQRHPGCILSLPGVFPGLGSVQCPPRESDATEPRE